MIAISRPLLGVEEETAILRVLRTGQLAQGEHHFILLTKKLNEREQEELEAVVR